MKAHFSKPKPCALCFHVPEQAFPIIEQQGFSIISVTSSQLNSSINDLLNQTPKEDFTKEPPQESMLVMAHCTKTQMNQLLETLRQEQIQISLKAVLTPTNQNWAAIDLLQELVRERTAIAEKRSTP